MKQGTSIYSTRLLGNVNKKTSVKCFQEYRAHGRFSFNANHSW